MSKDLSGQLATEGYIASYNIPRFVVRSVVCVAMCVCVWSPHL